MRNDNSNYDWSEAYDHSWLAMDRDNHVALVVCIDPYSLPSDFHLDWRWLSGIEERLAEYYSKTPCHCISFPDLSSLLRRKGFYVVDSYRIGKESKVEYLDPLPSPLDIEDLPESFKTIARFFTLPAVSFKKHQLLTTADWKLGIGHLPKIELFPMRRSVVINPLAHESSGLAIHPLTPQSSTRPKKFQFLEFRFLPDTNLVAEFFLPTPHIISWKRYYHCFKKLAKALFSISGSSNFEVILQNQFHTKDFPKELEEGPPLAIRYYCGESLVAELLLIDTFVNGRRYEFSMLASENIRKQFADSIHTICDTMGIEFVMIEDKPRPKWIRYAWDLLKRFWLQNEND